jgi:two-component system cell cycle sensor histidine kinase/response regulator CckA
MAIPLRLLILEDNPSDAELVLHALRRAGYEPTAERVKSEQDYVDHLQPPPEVILADFTMPELDALRAFEILRQRQLDIPFIIVSGTISEDYAAEIMQNGVTDYVIKDRLHRLGPAVKHALARGRLQEDKLLAEQTAARLAAIVESSPDAIIAKTLDGTITHWNLAAERLYGYSPREVLGRHISILFPPNRRRADAPESFSQMAQRLADGEPIPAFETVRVRKDGRRLEVLLRLSPIRDATGAVTGVSAIGQDITARKRSERFLAAQQAVADILTESRDLAAAGPRVLQTIGECLRWEAAVLWAVDPEANVLRRLHLWHSPWAETSFIGALEQQSVLERGGGVAGQIWGTGEPVWEPDRGVGNHPGAAVAIRGAGRRCGFGLPMGQGTELVGVIEFYTPEFRELDQALVAALDHIASQINQFCTRRRTEATLRASEERYRMLADSLPGGVYTRTADGACDYCNPWWCNYTGLSIEQLLRNGWADALHPDDRQPSLAHTAEARRTGQAFQCEHRFRGADGRYRWFLDRAVLLRDEQGRGVKWFGTCVDIDDRKRAEAERDQLLHRLQLQIERMPLAYLLFDADFRIIDWNPTAERIFGYARAEVLGLAPPYEKLVPRAFWEKANELLGRIRSGDMQAHSVNENLTKDGRTIQCEWFNTPLLDDQGQFTGLLCLVQDITERKSLEEQYRQSHKMEAVGQLAAGVAHDFNNLLGIILGYSELLLARLPAAVPDREPLRQIRSAADRAAGLTRQLLAFGRKQILAPVVLDLNSLVTELDKMLRRLIGEDVELITVLQLGLGRVKADPGQVEQIVMNLVLNARDAMPKGGRLTLQTANAVLTDPQVREHAGLPAGSYTLLTVSDTGCGMDAATRARIFEPFFTTKEVGKGTGLGLATVFGIAQQSGGFIEVESAPGSGSTFRIYFPHMPEVMQLRASEPGRMKMSTGLETILLVEDADDLRGLVQLILETSGYQVLSGRNGAEAEQVCRDFAGVIHLLFTDVVMPKMSGRQLADLLAPSRPDMKVLYMSGYTDDTMVRHGIQNTGTNFLPKPFTPIALAQKVREVLDSATRQQGLESPLVKDPICVT